MERFINLGKMQHQSPLHLKFDRKGYFCGFSLQLNNLLILFIKVNFSLGTVRNHILIKSHLWMNGSQAFCLPYLLFQNPHLLLMTHKERKRKKETSCSPVRFKVVILYRSLIQAIRKISKITQVWLFSGFRFLQSVQVSKFYQFLSNKFWQVLNFSSYYNVFNFPEYLIMKVFRVSSWKWRGQQCLIPEIITLFQEDT